MINLITFKVFLLVILLSSTTGIVLGQTVVTQEGENQIKIANNPCNDERYLELKTKSLDEMSDREYQYFLTYDEKCSEQNKSQTITRPTNTSLENKSSNDGKNNVNNSNNKSPKKTKTKGYLYTGFNFDAEGNYELDLDGFNIDEDVATGYSICTELMMELNENIFFGFGGEYQSPRTLVDFEDGGKFSFTPIYGIVRAYSSNMVNAGGTQKIYGIAKLGYSFYHEEEEIQGIELEKGNYFGLGAGLMKNRVQFEITWSKCSGKYKLENPDNSIDISYNKVSIGIGFPFSE